MITYNSTINFNTIKEKDILSAIKKSKKELKSYGISDTEINNINYSSLSCGYDVEKMLIDISICELLWYNKLYKEYTKFKHSLQKTFIYDNKSKQDTSEESRHYNTFLDSLTLIIQKYGKEILNEN